MGRKVNFMSKSNVQSFSFKKGQLVKFISIDGNIPKDSVGKVVEGAKSKHDCVSVKFDGLDRAWGVMPDELELLSRLPRKSKKTIKALLLKALINTNIVSGEYAIESNSLTTTLVGELKKLGLEIKKRKNK